MAQVSNITIDQGSTYTLVLTCVDTVGAAFNLTGYSCRAQIRKTRKATAITVSFTCAIQEPKTSGIIQLALTSEQTRTITAGETKNDAASKYTYDVEIYRGSAPEIVYRILEGACLIAPEVTR